MAEGEGGWEGYGGGERKEEGGVRACVGKQGKAAAQTANEPLAWHKLQRTLT